MLLRGADDRQHRQDDVSNEWRRKKPERRTGGEEQREQPATPAIAESEAAAESRAFARDSQSLEHEIAGGQSVTTVGGNGNHQFMNQARHEKNQQRGPSAPENRSQRPEREFGRELVKRRVPASPPEFRERAREQRIAHDRHLIHAGTPPAKRQQMKRAEVQHEN